MQNITQWSNFKIRRSLRNLDNIQENLRDLETLKQDSHYKDDTDLTDYLSSSMDEICKLAVVRCTGHIETVLKEMILKFLSDTNTHNNITHKITKNEFRGANPHYARINDVITFIFDKDSQPHQEFKTFMSTQKIKDVIFTEILQLMVNDRNNVSHGENVSIDIETVDDYINLTRQISDELVRIQSENLIN